MKRVTVVYTRQFNKESSGYLLESMKDWEQAVKESKMHSATRNGVLSTLTRFGKIFLNPFGGYCQVDGKEIVIKEENEKV